MWTVKSWKIRKESTRQTPDKFAVRYWNTTYLFTIMHVHRREDHHHLLIMERSPTFTKDFQKKLQKEILDLKI